MATNKTSYWKRFWHRTTSLHQGTSAISTLIGNNEVIDQLREGLNSYKLLKKDQFSQLQSSNPDQTKLLSVVQILQNYVDIDIFQLWEVIKHYLCDISYGKSSNALRNVAFVDTRPSFLLPNIWRFYHSERLFLLKLLQYIIENKDNEDHKYNKIFKDIFNKINVTQLKTSLLNQLAKVINATPPPNKIHNDFSDEYIKQEWAEFNLREQLILLQLLLLITNDTVYTEDEFKKLFELFRKHEFGKSQGYVDLLEERHRESVMKIMYAEVTLFMVIVDGKKITEVSTFIEATKKLVEAELVSLHLNQEHSAMLLTWMLFTLHSSKHITQFENQYQQFGATALKMRVFEFLHQLITSPVYNNNSKATLLAKQRIFEMLNELCDNFDSDGTLSEQPGAIQLCAELLKTPEVAEQFWILHKLDECHGTVSFWNTALEYFPHNFKSLSVLACSLAAAGKASAKKLTEELQNLPVYTEIYRTNSVPLTKISSDRDDVIVGRNYSPLFTQTYLVEAGSQAALIEQKDGTFIHFRTPYNYWTILNDEIQKALDGSGNFNFYIPRILEKIWDGTLVLTEIMKSFEDKSDVPKYLNIPAEGAFNVLVRFMRSEKPPLPIVVSCLQLCNSLIPLFCKQIHTRLINTGLWPRVISINPTAELLATNVTLDSAVIGVCLLHSDQLDITCELLIAYIDTLERFYMASKDEKIIKDIILPGVVFILREIFPNMCGWRYTSTTQKRTLMSKCIGFLFLIMQQTHTNIDSMKLIQNTCTYSFLYIENAFELLKIVSIGNDQLQRLMYDETSWVTGTGIEHLKTVQNALAIVNLVFKMRPEVAKNGEMAPLQRLIFAQNRHKDELKVVRKVTSYINHPFNNHLSLLCCRLLCRFAEDFKMSLLTCLEMSAFQIRVMFLERLKDEFENPHLNVSILEFVATCIGKQPGLTEAFFKLRYEKQPKEEKKIKTEIKEEDDGEGVVTYITHFLSIITSSSNLLYSPLLSCIMTLLHALWKYNMAALMQDLKKDPNFWKHVTSPLFKPIEPNHKTYGQIFNILSLELFNERENINSNLKSVLENFFDINESYLKNWLKFIYSFEGRISNENNYQVPVWLSLLTSWKDFTMVFCKCLPFSLNIAHKTLIAPPCIESLLAEIKDLSDGRLVVLLSEIYVILLSNWKEDCYDNRKVKTKQLDQLLTSTAVVYDSLHPRAKRAILTIATVAINTLDYEIKANQTLAHNVVRSVTNINTIELNKVFDDINGNAIENADNKRQFIPSIVLSLAMLEQCLELYDDMFCSGLAQWFQSSRFINNLLFCLHICLHKKQHSKTSIAVFHCLSAYCRGPFSKDLLVCDIDQYIWLQLLPPKLDPKGTGLAWKPSEWWNVYAKGLDFISLMMAQNGRFFASDVITFVGVHLEYLVESVHILKDNINLERLKLCGSALNLVLQLVKYEERWRKENLTSMIEITRSIRVCLYACVSICMRARRTTDAPHATEDGGTSQPHHSPEFINKVIEILHMSTVCLLSFSPDLLTLLAEPVLDPERWQPLVDIHFGTPQISQEGYPQLTFGTLLSAVNLLTKSLNHTYPPEEHSGSRSPSRRARSLGSPGACSPCSTSSCGPTTAPATLLAPALEVAATLLATQALLAVRDPYVPSRDKQLIRRELASELTVFHDFVRRRILSAAHSRPHLMRNKLGTWPLNHNEQEQQLLELVKKHTDEDISNNEITEELPNPPKKVQDSMREFVLRKHFLMKCSQTPTKEPPLPVSHSTPTSEKKKDSRKRVSWAETTADSEHITEPLLEIVEPAYSTLTDVQINSDEDYLHFMSVVFLYVCQTDL